MQSISIFGRSNASWVPDFAQNGASRVEAVWPDLAKFRFGKILKGFRNLFAGVFSILQKLESTLAKILLLGKFEML